MQLKRINFAMIWILLGTIGRLIPHPANVTPVTNLCLFAGSQLSKKLSFLLLFFSLTASDFLLAYLKGYSFFGSWSLFTYSGFAIITLIGSLLPQTPKLKILAPTVFACSLGFWLWTNLDTWLFTQLYLHNLSGLIACYIAALPFLRNALVGDLAWMMVIFGLYRPVGKFVPLNSLL